MPRYNLALIIKAMQRSETAAALRRTVEALLERGAVVRDLENMGERMLPYRIFKHNLQHSRAGYFLVDFEAPPRSILSIMDHLGRDVDVIRPTVLKHQPPKTDEKCPGLIPPDYETKFRSRRK